MTRCAPRCPIVRRTGRERSAGYLDYLLSTERRDDPGMNCPMTASASEIGRQGEEISGRFSDGFLAKAKAFEALLNDGMPVADKRRLAMTIVAAEIGAMAVARAVQKHDPDLSSEVLDAVRTVMAQAADTLDSK